MKDYLYIDSNDDSRQARFRVSYTSRIDNLISEERFEDALIEIEALLKTDSSAVNWNCKGIVLDRLSRYEESVRCFDMALGMNPSDEILLNKANALYDWAKVMFFPEGDYEMALRLIDCGLDALPQSEDASEFYFLKAEILEATNQLRQSHKFYLMAYKEFDRLNEFEAQCDYLENTGNTLINIVGASFYEFSPKPGDILTLIRDDENEHDRDAVAVIADNEKVGYVANNPYTLIDEVKSATDIRNIIEDGQQAEILFIYLGEYVIAKLI